MSEPVNTFVRISGDRVSIFVHNQSDTKTEPQPVLSMDAASATSLGVMLIEASIVKRTRDENLKKMQHAAEVVKLQAKKE